MREDLHSDAWMIFVLLVALITSAVIVWGMFVTITWGSAIFANTHENFVYNSQPHSKPPQLCGWESCCTGDINSKTFSCDYQGCVGSIPNWSAPDCSSVPREL
jgi:hypothetical protein